MNRTIPPGVLRVLWAAWFSLALSGCSGSGDMMTTSPTTNPMPMQAPDPSPTARYQVTFDATWSQATHPSNAFPANPHFSGLIGATHKRGLRLWEQGEIASAGIEAMAERGSKSPLDQEIERAIDQGRAENLLSGGGVDRSPGSVTLNFRVSLDQPAVTLVTMLAPSPDWFAGVSALDLLQDGDWVEELVVELHPYDAGTDSGSSYESRDRDTTPPVPISRIDGPPLKVDGSVPPVGTFTLRRL